jgi:UDP-4-amino-4,6-dideoxy-N-acetyl-beta-L-altrosamine transaminase
MTDFIPYSRQQIDDDDIAAVVASLRSDYLTTGPRVDTYEEAFAATCGARYAVAVSSGTAGLHLACIAAGIGPGSECITTPITFVATTNAALYCGGTPVFADVCDDTVNLDPEMVRERLTPRSEALFPVHFAGHPCDMQALHEIAAARGLMMIEDACHALGATTPDGIVGDCRYSDMTVFSTHPVKAIATGEGGVITTNSPALNDRLRKLRTHGITRDPRQMANDLGGWYYEMQELGYNYRLSDIQCALGQNQLTKLGKFIARRREIAQRYRDALDGIPGILLPTERSGYGSAWHLFVIRFTAPIPDIRRAAFDLLRAAGLGVNVHYLPVYLQPYYCSQFGDRSGLCPNAERYYDQAISIPLHAGMSDADVERVIATVRSVATSLQASIITAVSRPAA